MSTNIGDDHAWQHHRLEAPETDDNGDINWELLWLYRRKKGVQQPRPIFTGDVFENVPVIGEDDPVTVVVLQHPCALFDANNNLQEVLLAARLVDHADVSVSGWSGNYDIMPLVVHDSDPPVYLAVSLTQLVLVRSNELEPKKRVACMEIEGVSRLLQRWTNVNTRVVVPCWRFEQVVDAPFAEAEGMESWCAQRQQAGVKPPEAAKEATTWLDEKLPETGKPRRLMLKDPDNRKTMVRLMHKVAKERTERDLAEKVRVQAERKAAVAALPVAGSGELVADEAPPAKGEGEHAAEGSTRSPEEPGEPGSK